MSGNHQDNDAFNTTTGIAMSVEQGWPQQPLPQYHQHKLQEQQQQQVQDLAQVHSLKPAVHGQDREGGKEQQQQGSVNQAPCTRSTPAASNSDRPEVSSSRSCADSHTSSSVDPASRRCLLPVPAMPAQQQLRKLHPIQQQMSTSAQGGVRTLADTLFPDPGLGQDGSVDLLFEALGLDDYALLPNGGNKEAQSVLAMQLLRQGQNPGADNRLARDLCMLGSARIAGGQMGMDSCTAGRLGPSSNAAVKDQAMVSLGIMGAAGRSMVLGRAVMGGPVPELSSAVHQATARQGPGFGGHGLTSAVSRGDVSGYGICSQIICDATGAGSMGAQLQSVSMNIGCRGPGQSLATLSMLSAGAAVPHGIARTTSLPLNHRLHLGDGTPQDAQIRASTQRPLLRWNSMEGVTGSVRADAISALLAGQVSAGRAAGRGSLLVGDSMHLVRPNSDIAPSLSSGVRPLMPMSTSVLDAAGHAAAPGSGYRDVKQGPATCPADLAAARAYFDASMRSANGGQDSGGSVAGGAQRLHCLLSTSAAELQQASTAVRQEQVQAICGLEPHLLGTGRQDAQLADGKGSGHASGLLGNSRRQHQVLDLSGPISSRVVAGRSRDMSILLGEASGSLSRPADLAMQGPSGAVDLLQSHRQRQQKQQQQMQQLQQQQLRQQWQDQQYLQQEVVKLRHRQPNQHPDRLASAMSGHPTALGGMLQPQDLGVVGLSVLGHGTKALDTAQQMGHLPSGQCAQHTLQQQALTQAQAQMQVRMQLQPETQVQPQMQGASQVQLQAPSASQVQPRRQPELKSWPGHHSGPSSDPTPCFHPCHLDIMQAQTGSAHKTNILDFPLSAPNPSRSAAEAARLADRVPRESDTNGSEDVWQSPLVVGLHRLSFADLLDQMSGAGRVPRMSEESQLLGGSDLLPDGLQDNPTMHLMDIAPLSLGLHSGAGLDVHPGSTGGQPRQLTDEDADRCNDMSIEDFAQMMAAAGVVPVPREPGSGLDQDDNPWQQLMGDGLLPATTSDTRLTVLAAAEEGAASGWVDSARGLCATPTWQSVAGQAGCESPVALPASLVPRGAPPEHTCGQDPPSPDTVDNGTGGTSPVGQRPGSGVQRARKRGCEEGAGNPCEGAHTKPRKYMMLSTASLRDGVAASGRSAQQRGLHTSGAAQGGRCSNASAAQCTSAMAVASSEDTAEISDSGVEQSKGSGGEGVGSEARGGQPGLIMQQADTSAISKVDIAPMRRMDPAGANQMNTVRMRPNLADLIQYKLIEPGDYIFDVGTYTNIPAVISPDGMVIYQGSAYLSLSGFALAAIKSRNPNRQACDGWKEVRWKGCRLEGMRRECLARMRADGALP